jgi:hypothetical protein
MAMLVDSLAGELDAACCDIETSNMTTITVDSGTTNLASYITGLGDGPTTEPVETNCMTSGCAYKFAQDGTITQILPGDRTAPGG